MKLASALLCAATPVAAELKLSPVDQQGWRHAALSYSSTPCLRAWNMFRTTLLLAAVLSAFLWSGLPAFAQRNSASLTAEEFVGPFPSWANVKDYGAVGDGKADDTMAINRALEALRDEKRSKWVLWFPAGTYRITDTLKLLRDKHHEAFGVSIFGEDPERTIVRWDGPQDGIMFHYNAWHAALGRLTLDGVGRAKIALQHGKAFTTCNEISDMIIKDVEVGIEAGMRDGIAETAVLRCRFYRCSKVAISIQNWNSLDWYIWHCLFEDCQVGVTEGYGAGNFHVYQSIFRRSKEADIVNQNGMYYTAYGNYSVGSKRFWWNGSGNSIQLTIQQNTILDPIDSTPILGVAGPLVVLDNRIRMRSGSNAPVIRLSDKSARIVAIGNVANSRTIVETPGQILQADNQSVSAEEIEVAEPTLPGFPGRSTAPVIEIAPGSKTEEIQQAIHAAARLNGKRPVVHLPPGRYQLSGTLVLPAECDLQLAGDGLQECSALIGSGDGPAVRMLGPSHATVRNVSIHGGRNQPAVVIEGCDQPGGSVWMEQAQTTGSGFGLVVRGLDQTRVELRAHGHEGICVIGGPFASGGRKVPSQVNLFTGASSRSTGADDGVSLYDVRSNGRLLVRDVWFEGNTWAFLRLVDSGEFTLSGAQIAAAPRSSFGSVSIEGFRGKVALSEIGNWEHTTWKIDNSPNLKLLLQQVGNWRPEKMTLGKDIGQLAAFGLRTLENTQDTEFVKEMLEPLRSQCPRPFFAPVKGTTAVRIYRSAMDGQNGLLLLAGSSEKPPGVPSGLASNRGLLPSQLRLTWKGASGNEHGFRIERQGIGESWRSIGTSDAATGSFVDSQAVPTRTYAYRVSAYNSAGQSPPSPEIQVTAPEPGAEGVKINCGGPMEGQFLPDMFVEGGGVHYTYNRPVDMSKVEGKDPAPMRVYQIVRHTQFRYRIPGMKPKGHCLVRLHYCENYNEKPGEDAFLVKINGKIVQENFDLFTAAGGRDKAMICEFPATADDQGVVTIDCSGKGMKLGGLEVLPLNEK